MSSTVSAAPGAYAGDASSGHDARIETERLRLLVNGLGPALIGGVAVSLMLVGLMWDGAPRSALLAWFGVQLSITALRAWHLSRLQRIVDDVDLRARRRQLLVLIGLAGFGWGSLGGFIEVLEEPQYRAVIVAALAGVTAGSATVYALLMPAARLFLALSLLPPALALFRIDGHVDAVLGLMMICYMLVMLRNARNLNKGLDESLALRFEHADVAAELLASRKHTETLNRDLQQKLTQLEATQRELVVAKELAESAASAKSEFLANMSHEIRTPMNGVLGMAELLLDTALTERQSHLAATIHRSGRQLLSVINDVLDFSKFESGKLELEAVAFDLRELLEDIGELFAETAHRAGVELICDVPPDLPATYRGDPARLRQVLTNLVSNALKFTSEGEVILRVVPPHPPHEPDLVRFEVLDSGIGIRPEHQERIFDSFTQADGSTTRQFGGTGLGLAICRQLSGLMGGAIGLHSEWGRGSTFWFTCRLPLVSVAEERDPSLSGQSAAPLADWQLMLVGKPDTARAVLNAQMTHWGGLVTVADDAVHALALLDEAAFAGRTMRAIVFPRDLQGLTAAQFVATIRSNAALATPRLIMLMTVADVEASAENLAGHIDAHLIRPLRQRVLLAALRDEAEHRIAAPGPADAASDTRVFSARVLVVEDNLVNQELAQSMLEALGCRCEVVSNGAQAVTLLTGNGGAYDLVLMDCQMPVMDGYAASRAVRAWEIEQGSAQLPIVALTANALEGDRERCLAAGMSDYLPKPFTREALRDVLAGWLPLAASPRAPRAATATVASPPPAVAAAAAVIDRKAIDRINSLQREGKPDLLGKLIGLYGDSANELVAEIEAGAASADAGRVQRAAHTLKSSSANLGAEALAQRCAAIEECVREQRVADLDRLITGLASATAAVIDALHALRPNVAA